MRHAPANIVKPETMADSFNLERFIQAQNDVIDSVRAELRNGYKSGHWMWFIFPQMRGLGSSWMANHYAISSRYEGDAYLSHHTLGPRLIECAELVNLVEGRSVVEIFGHTDSLKFRSSMTLFAALNGSAAVFSRALEKYFAGAPDRRTLSLLEGA